MNFTETKRYTETLDAAFKMVNELSFVETYAVMPDVSTVQSQIDKVLRLCVDRVQTEVLGNDDPYKRLYAYKDICKYYLSMNKEAVQTKATCLEEWEAEEAEGKHDLYLWFNAEAISNRLKTELQYSEQQIYVYLEQLTTLQTYILDKALQLQEMFVRIDASNKASDTLENLTEAIKQDGIYKWFDFDEAKARTFADGCLKARNKTEMVEAFFNCGADTESKNKTGIIKFLKGRGFEPGSAAYWSSKCTDLKEQKKKREKETSKQHP